MSGPGQQQPRRGGRPIVAAGAILAMVLATVGLAIWIISVKTTPPEAPPPSAKRVPVEVMVVRPERFTHRIQALGTVRPLREASVASQVAGPIVAIPEGVELGARMERGQLLAQIKRTSYAIARQEAEALLAQQQATYELVKAEADRMQALFHEGIVSRSEHDVARERLTLVAAEIARAEARLARAKEDLANTRITAPFAGLIAEKAAEVGDHVSVGQAIVRLVDIARVKVLINVPTEDIHALRPGLPAEVSVVPFPDRPFNGVVANVGFEGEVANRTFPVEVVVENPPDLPLRVGMFATARLAVRTYDDLILVDRRLIQRGPDGPALFVADPASQVARLRPVRLGRRFGERYQILRGLAPGDVLITEGVELLSDGAPIRLPPSATAATTD